MGNVNWGAANADKSQNNTGKLHCRRKEERKRRRGDEETQIKAFFTLTPPKTHRLALQTMLCCPAKECRDWNAHPAGTNTYFFMKRALMNCW